MMPKGTLLIIGGAENKGGNKASDIVIKNSEIKHFEILKMLINGKEKVEIITTASQYQKEVKEVYQRAFNKIGFKNTGFISIEEKSEASQSKYLKRIQIANAIFFSGGDQSRLSRILGGTPLIDLIAKRYIEDENLVLAGTSAGAMAMSKTMISGGGSNEALFKNDLKTKTGFGVLEHCIVDTHFIKRGRFSRLAHAVLINPGQLGVGLGEDTALIVKNGKDAECLGSGMVVIIDSTGVGQSNISEEENKCGVFVENLKVHLLVKGCLFNLKTRMLAKPAMNTIMKKANGK